MVYYNSRFSKKREIKVTSQKKEGKSKRKSEG
jgi:hypothetical protein